MARLSHPISPHGRNDSRRGSVRIFAISQRSAQFCGKSKAEENARAHTSAHTYVHIKRHCFERAVCTADFRIVTDLSHLRGSSGYHRLRDTCNSSAMRERTAISRVTRVTRECVAACRRVRQLAESIFTRLTCYTRPCTPGRARVRISTKSSIV